MGSAFGQEVVGVPPSHRATAENAARAHASPARDFKVHKQHKTWGGNKLRSSSSKRAVDL